MRPQTKRNKGGRAFGYRYPRIIEILEEVKSHCEPGEENSVFVYGSQIRGNAIPESDLDLMVMDDVPLYRKILAITDEISEKYKIPISVQFGNSYCFKNSIAAFWRGVRYYAKSLPEAIALISAEK